MADNGTENGTPAGGRWLSEGAVLHELGRRLVEGAHLTRNQLEDATSRATLLGRGLDEILRDEELVPEPTLLAVLSDSTQIPFKPIGSFAISREAIARVPAATALNYRIVPVELKNGTLTVATSHFCGLADQESFQTLFGATVRWVFCRQHDIDEAIKHFYGLGADIVKDMLPLNRVAVETPGGGEMSAEAEGAGAQRLVQEIIHEAIQMNASDIHIEPMEARVSLRYRVDGVLCPIPLPAGANRFQKSIVSAIKVIAQLNITERRLPHDGRIRMSVGPDKFDIRVSILPTQFGEAVDLRILNRKTTFLAAKDLGLLDHQKPAMDELLRRSYGIILITGPTGSGKTTTLYATLARLRTDAISIVTIEDPVEYQMDGILQIQAHPEIGMDFAAGLRAVLRHDPNVILIGEIRDTETADIAIKSSLTGHLVFSTLHTNDAASAIARLVDMGVEPYLVASSLQGVVAQRLVRRICASCREPVTVPPEVTAEIAAEFGGAAEPRQLFRGRGCPDCKYTGYRGRQAVFEILPITDSIRPMIVRGAMIDQLRQTAIEQGMTTLRRNGWQMALDGVTTVEEVMRVTHVEH